MIFNKTKDSSKMQKKSSSDLGAKIFFAVLLTILTVCIIYPLLFTITTSFKTYAEFLKDPFKISFTHPENYTTAWIEGEIGTLLGNSLYVVVISVIGHVLSVCLISYAIGILRFKGSGIIMALMLSGMFLTSEVTSIPKLIMIRDMNLLNTLWALIVPYVFSPGGMAVILMSNFMKRLPEEVIEASELDGAGFGHLFFSVVLPMSMPIIAFTAIQQFNGVWNDFMWPLIALARNQQVWTIPLGLIRFQGMNNSEYGELCAGLVIMMLPTVTIYACFSKYFLEGAAAGAVKG